ncbi:hypothetical protein HTZ84_05330 [Haloterrigena sp. SYSU A558-1]|uniref:Uncharacterized protein n=1 Tax=Haloterrigena gelatinilytica TaxID=2741724 RepID=A0ABX2LD30_9EURY|nr:hypothetical protein [Haloterrigena gelatinilytica]NUC71736.1 hypothetical protein [Haloterrigena gelatinilytica]
MQRHSPDPFKQDNSSVGTGGSENRGYTWHYGERVIDEVFSGRDDLSWDELEKEIEEEAKKLIEFQESGTVNGPYQESEELQVKVDTLQQRVSTLEVLIEHEMTTDTATIDISEFRTFLGLSSLASVAFLVLFLVMFSADILPVALVAALTVILFLSALGFGRLWYDLSDY